MKKKEKRIIFEAPTGSHLFGTNNSKSDMDFMGIFLHSTEDSFTLNEKLESVWDLSVKNSCGQKNTSEDIDRKFSSLQEFFRLALSGQSRETEALFVPDSLVITTSEEWAMIKKNKSIFLSKNSISSFLSFSRHQALKATLKGENLNSIRQLVTLMEKEIPSMYVGAFLAKYSEEPVVKTVQYVKTDKGSDVMVFVGKRWDFNSSLKRVKENLKKIELTYGARSEQTASVGYDFKSLHHAYRLMLQAKEFLTTGFITLPRPKKEADFLKMVKTGVYHSDYFKELNDLENEINELLKTSTLPEKSDAEKAKILCQEIMYNHLLS